MLAASGEPPGAPAASGRHAVLRPHAAGGLPPFTTAEYARRWAAFEAELEREQLDAAVVFGSGGADLGVQYLTGWPATREAWLIVAPGSAPALLVQFYNHVPNAQRLAVLDDVRWAGPSSPAAVAEQLRARGVGAGRVGLAGSVSFQSHAALAAALPGASLVDLTPGLARLRQVKSDEEVAWLRRAAELSDASMAALERQVQPGTLESELPAIVEDAYLRRGGQNYIHYFGVTPMATPDVCVPSQRPSDRPVRAGDVLICEISAQVWGYAGQILRSFAVASEPTPPYARLHAVAEDAFQRICHVLRDGATAAQVVEAAAVIEDAGFTIRDDLLHGFGGGYLRPILRSRSSLHEPIPDFTFRTNMTVVVQPNVVTPDERAGVQFGELVRITPTGVERLHTYPGGFRRCG